MFQRIGGSSFKGLSAETNGKVIGMLTRGHLIGQIIDDLAGISAQAKQRARLHLFDLHTHVEDFAKEVLNRALKMNLVNLNDERSNYPGLDLGDVAEGWAFQVTADKSRSKIQKTLENIDDAQREKYRNIRILVIGEKQGSYSLDGEPFKKFGFTADNIWDFNDVCARIMGLPIDVLQDLSRYVSSENRRVRIELEIPDENGSFPTSIEHLMEAIPSPKLSDAKKMEAHFQKAGEDFERQAAEDAIQKLSEVLKTLPRLTREVFKVLLERRDQNTTGWGDAFRISIPKLERIYRGDDLEGDLSLLIEAHLIDCNEPDNPGEAAYWRIFFPGSHEHFHLDFLAYAEAKKISLNKPIVSLDFSDF
ncbi:MAG: SMEK domain-containing protein [Bacteroidota bacterium]